MHTLLVALLAASVPVAPASTLTISPSVPEAHLRWLADPAREGRMTLSPQIEVTAEYIAGRFREWGLKPAGNDGFFHTYEVTANQKPGELNTATFYTAQGRVPLEMGKDYVPVVGSAHRRLLTAPVVFVGSNLASQASELKGKWVMMYRSNSSGDRERSAAARALAYAQQGAAGIIWVGPVAEGRLELPMPARSQGISPRANVPAVAISRSVFERVTGLRYGYEPERGDALPINFRAVTDLVAKRGTGRNVIAALPGTDPKLRDEVIVVGAHHDHLGFGEVASRTGNDIIHPGADDNGSGVAGVLALAEYFARTGGNRRTILFQTYCGEEIGLLGSRAWVRDHMQSTVPKIQAMINMDMIGRLRNEALTVFCVNSASEWQPMLTTVQVAGVRMNLVMSSPGNSDHGPFIAARVPALFFHTGLTEEYHTERDTLETINFDGMARVIEVVRQTMRATDALDHRMAFTAQSPSAQGGSPTGAPTRRARVGFIPDMAGSDSRGLRLTGVVTGSPAEAAGVKAGDILVRFGVKEIRTIEDLQTELFQARPGVAVKIVVLRGDQRLELTLTPSAPQG